MPADPHRPDSAAAATLPPGQPRHQAPPGRLVWLGIAGTVAFDCVGQVLWKRIAGALPDSADPRVLLGTAVQVPLVWLMAALMLAQLGLWLAVLRRSELSFAQPATSLSYVGVGVLSWWWLGETITTRTVLSIALILAGVVLISGSGPGAGNGSSAADAADGTGSAGSAGATAPGRVAR